MPQIPSALSENYTGPSEPSVIAGPEVLHTTDAPEAAQVSLYDHSNNHVIQVAHDDLPAYLQSNQYSLSKGSTLNFIPPGGESAVEIDGNEAHTAIKAGYTLETLADQHARRTQAQYGGIENLPEAFGMGAARGATFGASDVAANLSGGAERQAGIQEANPVASTLGELTGIIAPAVLTGGVWDVVGAPLAGVSIAGRATERFLAKQAMKAGLSNVVAKSVIEKIGPAAIGSIVEGTFFGTGQLVSESALGKADFNAENLVTYGGMGALLGGALGAAGKTALELVPVAGEVLKPLARYAEEFTNRDKAALEVTGYTPARAAKMKANNPEMAGKLADFLQHDVKIAAADSAADLELKVAALKKEAGAEVGTTIKEADVALANAPELEIKSKDVFQDLATKLEERFMGGKGPKSPEMRESLEQVEKYYEKIIKAADDSGNVTLEQLHKFRKAADDLAFTESGMGVTTLKGRMAKFARREYNDILKSKIAEIGEKLNMPELAGRFSEANRKYSYSSEILPNIMRKAAKSETINPLYAAILGGMAATGVPGSIGAVAGLAGSSFIKSDLQKNLLVLGKIEKAKQYSTQMMKKVVESFKAAQPMIRRAEVAVLPPLIESSISRDYSQGSGGKKARTMQEAYTNTVSNIQTYQQAPAKFLENTNRQTASMFKAAPETSSQVDALTHRGMDYIASKMPKQAINPSFMDAYRPPRLPSNQELSKFNRVLQAVEKPASVLEGIARGTATREEVDALKAVYPATYENMRDMFITAMPKMSKTMSYQKKIQLGMLLDVPTDRSLQTKNILGLQEMFGEPPATEGVMQPTQTMAGAKNLDKADRMETGTQKVAADGAGQA